MQEAAPVPSKRLTILAVVVLASSVVEQVIAFLALAAVIGALVVIEVLDAVFRLLLSIFQAGGDVSHVDAETTELVWLLVVLLVPALMTLVALVLLLARRPTGSMVLATLATLVSLIGGVAVIAANSGDSGADAIGRICTDTEVCPAGYECVGERPPMLCQISCAAGAPPCPADTHCVLTGVIGPHCEGGARGISP